MDAKSQADGLKEAAKDTMDDFQDASEDIQNRLANIWEAGREKATVYARNADQKIRENPYQAVGIAFGLGLVVGLLLTRRGGSDQD
jgi:ElaB/YqjD/DUF883 family membrane-anchored ribosome-binding protein